MERLYLYLNIFTLLGPLALSFDRKVAFYKEWKWLFPAIGMMGLFFISWDVWFTHTGVWGFNQNYLTGINIVNLPVEEWLFFFTVPFACLFIYACLNAYLKKDLLDPFAFRIGLALGVVLLILAVINYQKLYTSITFGLTAVYLLILCLKVKPRFFSRFLLAYFVAIIPFFIVNGILTGTGIEEQVVWYNSAEILNIRLGTIPIEDSIYNLLMLLMTTHWYHFFKSRSSRATIG